MNIIIEGNGHYVNVESSFAKSFCSHSKCEPSPYLPLVIAQGEEKVGAGKGSLCGSIFMIPTNVSPIIYLFYL